MPDLPDILEAAAQLVDGPTEVSDEYRRGVVELATALCGPTPLADRDERNARYRTGLCVDCGKVPHSAGRPRCDGCHRIYSRGVAHA